MTKKWLIVEEEVRLSGAQQAQLLQQFLVASTKANQQLSKASKDQTDLEKNRPKLVGEISRSKWIEHSTKFSTYKDSDGNSTLLQSIDSDLHDYIAEYILDDTVAVLKALNDQEITILINTFTVLTQEVDIQQFFQNCRWLKPPRLIEMKLIPMQPNFLEPYERIQHSTILVMVEQMKKSSIKFFSLEFSLLSLSSSLKDIIRKTSRIRKEWWRQSYLFSRHG